MRLWRSWTGSHHLRPEGGEEKHPPNNKGGSLRLRLMLTLTIALAPIVLASIIQGMDRAARDTAEVRERLVEAAHAAGSNEENMLAAAEQITRALANLAAVRDAEPGCGRALADTLKGLSFFTNIARIDGKGRVICSANPRAVGRVVSAQATWHQAMTSHDFALSERMVSPLTQRQVISGMLPLMKDGNAFGAIAIGIDVHWLDYMVHSSKLPQGAVVAIFDRKGAIIASNDADIANAVFAHPVLTGTALHSANDKRGNVWTYATAPMLHNSVFAGFTMRQSSLFGPTYVHVGTDFILPILMIVLTWIAIWIGTERQVTRWLVQLRRISAAYRSGHYTIRPSLDGASLEFRQLGDALAAMAQAIQERDRHLREAVDQKSVLIREVHHRVKNNLQIVMSLLNLQAGRTREPAVKAALRQAQARINALALVHRTLNDIEDQSMVQFDRLLADLTEQTCEGFGAGRAGLIVETKAMPLLIGSHTAVPLALFTVEALTNVFKHAYPEGRGGHIRVSLEQAADKELFLRVADNGVGFNSENPDIEKNGTSIGTQLLSTFAQQIGGVVSMRSERGTGTSVELRFPVPKALD